MSAPDTTLERWRADPPAFFEEMLRVPETGARFVLVEAQRTFLREAFRRREDGRLLSAEWVFAAPKKSGKTTLAAGLVLYTALIWGGRFAEAYVLANDLEQSTSRVFRQAARLVETSPLRKIAQVLGSEIRFEPNRAVITALASDFRGAAGGNQVLSAFDEAWAYTTEAAHRLFDEMAPVPTREISARLITTSAGFENESELLWQLYQRGLKGEQIAPGLYRAGGLLMFWTHELIQPWQTPEWVEDMRQSQRPSAFTRMILNTFTAGEESFVPSEQWAACEDAQARPIVADKNLPVWVGVDASVKRDSTAVVACAWDAQAKKVRLVWHRVFQPSPDNPLDFQATIVQTLLDLRGRLQVREVRYDPYQMAAVAQELQRAGLPMVEFPQSLPNLTEASTNLYDLIKGRNLVVYSDEELRRAVQRAVAVETSRGLKIAKEKASHKIDVVVALSLAALGAVAGAGVPITAEMFQSFGERATAPGRVFLTTPESPANEVPRFNTSDRPWDPGVLDDPFHPD